MKTKNPSCETVKLSTLGMMILFTHKGNHYRTAGPPRYNVAELNEGLKRDVIELPSGRLVQIPYKELVKVGGCG